jgi:hypothetical protein
VREGGERAIRGEHLLFVRLVEAAYAPEQRPAESLHRHPGGIAIRAADEEIRGLNNSSGRQRVRPS